MKNLLIIISLISTCSAYGMQKQEFILVSETATLKKEFEKADLADFAFHSEKLLNSIGGKERSRKGLKFGITTAVTNYLYETNKQFDEIEAKKLKDATYKIILQ